MLKERIYLKILFVIIGAFFTTTLAYSYYFSKHYPLPITNRISLDAKLQFIRTHINPDEIDTLVIGSSLALNNIQGKYLEEASQKCKKVLNLSVFGTSPVQMEQLLLLTDAFPNLERIIYSTQFTDFGHASKFKTFDANFIKKYIRNELNPFKDMQVLLDGCKDLSFCIERQKGWLKKHGQNNKFEFLGFDHTGSAPLHIYGEDILQKRWTKTDGDLQNPEAYAALYRMAKLANEKNIKFYLVQQPYRKAMVDKYKHLQSIMTIFPKRMTKTMKETGGEYLNLYEKLKLDDSYFADRSHLNDKGSILTAKEIARFIDSVEQ